MVRILTKFGWIGLVVVWLILSREEPFRSHFKMTLLCIGALAALAGLLLAFVEQGRARKGLKMDVAPSDSKREKGIRWARALTLVFMVLSWTILDHKDPFQFDLKLTMLGFLASAIFVWVMFEFIQRFARRKHWGLKK